jgi:hypothetical protein
VSGSPDLPPTAVELTIALIRTECNAVIFQCNAGPTSSSSIFSEDLISEEGVPAGIFVRVLGEILDNGVAAGLPLTSMANCIKVMFETRVSVLHAFTSMCPNPTQKGSFCDPRPILAETWFLAVNRLLTAVLAQGGFDATAATSDLMRALRQLLVETCVSSVGLLLYPSLGKTQDKRLNDIGMSLDGAQTLVMLDFLQLYFSLGPSMLQAAAKELQQTIHIDHGALQTFSNEPDAAGIAIIGASLFRAAQGGLPPWGVEYVPAVYSSFYHALDKNPSTFGLVFQMSMHVRLAENHTFGGVQGGRLLSGQFFYKICH